MGLKNTVIILLIALIGGCVAGLVMIFFGSTVRESLPASTATFVSSGLLAFYWKKNQDK
ncbi:MAG: hypothetical protein J6M18_02455 [Actinomycetaceae bacterium]|nr:hypothetical protein [Actinomycetaceae bacterium]